MAMFQSPYGFNAPQNMQPLQPMSNAYQNLYNYANQYTNQQTASGTVNNGIIWVQGIEGAKAYQLAPNSNIMLLDSDNEGIFYIKTSDNVGMCNLRIFKYTEQTATNTAVAPNIDMSQYVTRDELNSIIATIKGEENNGEQSIPTAKPAKSSGSK